MKANKVFSLLILYINIVGMICLIYFASFYFTHNTEIPNPDAMLAAERWDLAGMALTIGIIPLFIVNLLGFLFVKVKRHRVQFLFFFPSIICVAIVAHYWMNGLF